MPAVHSLSNAATTLSLSSRWLDVPPEIKDWVVQYTDRGTRQALCRTNRELRTLVENRIVCLVIKRLEALSLLIDPGRFKNCRTICFNRPINATQLGELRKSISGIELVPSYRYDDTVIQALVTRPWESVNLGKWKNKPPLGMKGCVSSIDIVSCLSKLSQSTLTRLNLNGWHLIDADALVLAEIKTLEVLSLLRAKITDNGALALAGLPRLRKLAISESHLQAPGLLALLNSTSLRSLTIRETNLGGTEDALWERLSRHSSLSELDLSECALHNQPHAVDYLSKNTSIKRLRLARNDLGNEAVCLIAGMPSLVELDVAANKVDRAGVLALACHPRITRLNLSSNEITSDGLDALIAGGTVQSLTLHYCSLKERDLAALWNSSSIRKLDVGGNFTPERIVAALSRPAARSLREVSIASGPPIFLEDVSNLISKGVAATGMKFSGRYATSFTYSGIYILRGVDELEEMTYSTGFENITALYLVGGGFGNGKLALLPKDLSILILDEVDALTASDLEALRTLPYLTKLMILNTAVDNSGITLLTSLESLQRLTLRGMTIDSPMRQALACARRDLEIDVPRLSALRSFSDWASRLFS